MLGKIIKIKFNVKAHKLILFNGLTLLSIGLIQQVADIGRDLI